MPTRLVKPLKKGEKAIGAHFGGPLINFSGAPVITPFTSVTVAKGLTNDMTLFTSIHTTSALFGVLQTDLGLLKSIYESPDSTFGITISPQINAAVDKWEGNFKIWPILELNGYWNYKRNNNNFIYTGITNWFELASKRAHNEPQPNFWLPTITIGHQFTKTKVDYFIETKYIAPFNSNDETVVDYIKLLGRKGITGVYLGFRKKF